MAASLRVDSDVGVDVDEDMALIFLCAKNPGLFLILTNTPGAYSTTSGWVVVDVVLTGLLLLDRGLLVVDVGLLVVDVVLLDGVLLAVISVVGIEELLGSGNSLLGDSCV